ncbi:MAG: DUF4340 domain-containing protein [Pseudomonadota bacterium]|nr:DUF4340 domain-containing protein [Pseudomonadota bacterium]
MRRNSLFGLGLAAVAAVALAIVLVGREASENQPLDGDERMFAGLLDRANDVSIIEIGSGGEKFSIERLGEHWVLREKSDYPAKFEAVKKTIIDVAELELISRKTNNPERHGVLGLGSPSAEEGAALAIQLLDQEGGSLASLFVGYKDRSGRDLRYVRYPNDNQTWLGSRGLEIATDPLDWLDKTLMSIRHDRVRRILFSHSDGDTSELERLDRALFKYTVKDLPAGMKMVSPAIVNASGGGLSFLQFLDVRPLAEVSAGSEPITRTTLQTWDGLIITISMFEFEDFIWTHFDAVFDQQLFIPLEKSAETEDGNQELDKGQSVQKEAQDIVAQHSTWAYLIEAEKIEKLRRRSEELMEPDVPEEGSEVSPAEEPAE